ncbi:hypothetical protein CDV31_016358 [Fusarium ambrosium]|uniref:LysM domain-containing protein n=1 Tax=Fusarium ambrosium TaxID=131363 RepID=A0A428SAE0_9HYPO|nr:hypothetical protein CDV31_016358 [Fusarium ambrosium]
MHWFVVLSNLAISARIAIAWQYISPDALPSDSLSDSCKAALVVDLNCPSQVGSFFEREPVPLAPLQEACTPACRISLGKFEASLKKECGEEDVVEYEPGGGPVHISVVATDIYYHFTRTCLKDGDRWCHIWAFENSPDNLSRVSGSAQGKKTTLLGHGCGIVLTGNTAVVTSAVDMCDNCIIIPFQFQAGTSYSDGYDLQGAYASLTKSCSKTGFPLKTTVTDDPSATTGPATPSCSGDVYTIKTGDDCRSISRANDVATSWMLYDNGLQAFCNEFPSVGENICIMNKCKTYTVQADDTCQGIAVAANITMVQLYTWKSCERLSMSVGDTICLEPHDDEDYAPITRTATTESPAATAAPVPSNISNGTNENCAQFYSVEIGDYCNQVIMKFSISLQDFLFLNQGVNDECTNLFAKESYCVLPVGPINMYPGHPEYIDPATEVPDIDFDDLPSATFTAPVITGVATYLPRANGTRKDCYIFMDGTDLQVDMSWGFSFSACVEVVNVWGISLDELQNWNPSLDTASPDCAFGEEYSYCMAAYKRVDTYTGEPDEPETAITSEVASSTTSKSAEPTSTELPIRDGAAEGCKTYYAVIPPMTCQDVLDANKITIAQFYAMNPSVGAECYNLWPDYRYCVEM